MFDFLKKKITGFIDKLTSKEESKEPEPVPEAPEQEVEEPQAAFEAEVKMEELAEPEEKPAPEFKEEKKPEPELKKDEKRTTKEKIPEPIVEKKPEPEKKKEEKKPEPIKEKKPELVEEKKSVQIQEKKPEPLIAKQKIEKKEPEKPKPAQALPKYEPEKDRKKEVRLGAFKAIKSFVTREVEISESDVRELLDNLELEMLESDVELSVAEGIRNDLLEKLIGKTIPKSGMNAFIKNAIRETLLTTMSTEAGFDFLDFMRSREKPVKIVFLGLNGTGKTTTIAKFARLLMDNKFSVVFAAGDTFRAAAIEQMEVHAIRLGVRLIKRDYGADPTSVGYDAVGYAKAHSVDVVLIDTAGRQDTNVNLINELKKMSRILQPDLKLYIGESIAGSSVIEQVSTFKKEIGVDGIILTKLDCDPKGGSVLSISKATGIPIIYIGTGQGYGDLEVFNAEKIVERILG